MVDWHYIALPEEVQKHMGPGPHPSGSPQSVHAKSKRARGDGLLATSKIEQYKKAWRGRRDTRSLEAQIRREAYVAYFKTHKKTKANIKAAKAAVDKLIASIRG